MQEEPAGFTEISPDYRRQKGLERREITRLSDSAVAGFEVELPFEPRPKDREPIAVEIQLGVEIIRGGERQGKIVLNDDLERKERWRLTGKRLVRPEQI